LLLSFRRREVSLLPKDHVGALSGVTYVSPALDDDSDIEVAFAEFADSIPAAPRQLTVEAVTASKDATVNFMYINEGSGPVTLTLPAGVHEGDKVTVYQIGNPGREVSLVGGAGVSYQGPQTTTGQYTAVTAIWHNGKWVGSPFSFSGVRPTASTGGEITDLNGRRYHVFRTPGAFTFMSHKDQTLRVDLIGAGGNGVTSAVGDSGEGGYSGQVLLSQPLAAFGLDYIAVTVPGPAGAAKFGPLTAAGGQNGIPGTQTPNTPPTALSGDLAALLGPTVGGSGGNAVGPVNGGQYGKGGGGGFDLLASYAQSSYVYSWTTGGPYTYDCSYGARGESYDAGGSNVAVIGDPCVGGQCPPGWGCVSAPPDWVQRCHTTVYQPNWQTRYHCDSGGSLSGTTCVRTCSGDNTQHHSETRWNPCNAGYSEVNHVCVDSRPVGGGMGGGGAVVVSYAIP
jgi:hypothetical protein